MSEIELVYPKREEMDRCIARFSELDRVSKGLPDMHIEGYHRTFMAVMQYTPPPEPGKIMPFGSAITPKISHLKPGYGLAFIKAEPGNGVMMHSHDTYESFLVIDGVWRLTWEGADGVDHADLGALDFICVPVGVNRAFECIEGAPGSSEGTMLGFVGGDDPRAIPTPEALAACEAAGPPPVQYA